MEVKVSKCSTVCFKPILYLMQMLGINLKFSGIHGKKSWRIFQFFLALFLFSFNLWSNIDIFRILLFEPERFENNTIFITNIKLNYLSYSIYTLGAHLSLFLCVVPKWVNVWQLIQPLEFHVLRQGQRVDFRKKCVFGVVCIIILVSLYHGFHDH